MRSKNNKGFEPSHIALIEEIIETEEYSSGNSHIILDCITFKAACRLKNMTWLNSNFDEALNNTMLLSVSCSHLKRLVPFDLDKEQWIEFSLEPAGKHSEENEHSIIASFVSLSGPINESPLLRFKLSHINKIKPPFKNISLLAGLESRKNDIKSVLDEPLSFFREEHLPRNVIVYDIGQGNATALVDQRGIPVIFFDLGWPTVFNHYTRPVDPPDLFAGERCNICFNRSVAPVILSHWDYDHWAYAVENDNYNFGKQAANMTFKSEAISRPWILPKPPRIKNTKGLGPTHLRFLTSLPQRILWSNRIKRVNFRGGTLTRSNPQIAPTDRNNQGLAWFVRMPGKQETLLLPGDASFNLLRMPNYIPQYTGLMASHHGGKISGVIPSVSPSGKLTISVGFKNLHRHPDENTLKRYKSEGWINDDRTSTQATLIISRRQNGSIIMKLFPNEAGPNFMCPALLKGNMIPAK